LRSRRPAAVALFNVHLDLLLRAQVPAAHGATIALQDKAVAEVTKADVEAVRAERRVVLAKRSGAKQGEVGINCLLSRLRHLLSWAVGEGFITETPFKRGA
jgi:cob(I)alamin adenosyltransferase